MSFLLNPNNVIIDEVSRRIHGGMWVEHFRDIHQMAVQNFELDSSSVHARQMNNWQRILHPFSFLCFPHLLFVCWI